MNGSKSVIGIVLPCYNEQHSIDTTFTRLDELLSDLISKGEINEKSFIAFVDDGSKDNTWQFICKIRDSSENVKAIKLSRNFGHQNALLAGLFSLNEYSDCLITIDADLQDDIKIIPQMIAHFNSGSDIVYGIRRKRNTDSFFKKSSALGFYYLMKKMRVNIIFNHADFRLASKKAINELEKFAEVNLFLRGIFPAIGLNTASVYYDRVDRNSGHTKYPLTKMLSFAIDGITSFSIYPLRMITTLGIVIFIGSMIMLFYAIYSYFRFDVVKGWTSVVLPMYFLGGIQLLSIGIIGEYLGKIYKETKQRPRYIIEKQIL